MDTPTTRNTSARSNTPIMEHVIALDKLALDANRLWNSLEREKEKVIENLRIPTEILISERVFIRGIDTDPVKDAAYDLLEVCVCIEEDRQIFRNLPPNIAKMLQAVTAKCRGKP